MFSASELIALLLCPAPFILHWRMYKSALITFVLKFGSQEFGRRPNLNVAKFIWVVCVCVWPQVNEDESLL